MNVKSVRFVGSYFMRYVKMHGLKKRKVGGCWWNCINGTPPEATVVFKNLMAFLTNNNFVISVKFPNQERQYQHLL